MFAASTCSSVACQAVLRENFVKRGRTAVIVPEPSSARGATTTQSPTTGSSAVRRRLVHEAAGDLAAKLAVLGEHVVGTSVLDRDPAGDGVAVREGLVQAAQPVVPAERFELQASGNSLSSSGT